MNSVWNLDPIYHGFDDPAFEADLAQLKDQVEKLSALAGRLSQMDDLDGLKQGIDIQENMARLAGKLALYAELRQAADTRDTAASSQMGRIMAACSALTLRVMEWAMITASTMVSRETSRPRTKKRAKKRFVFISIS